MTPPHPGRTAAALVAMAALASTAASAQPGDCKGTPSGTKLDVVVDNVRDSQGLLAVTLYGSDSGKFLRHGGSLSVWREPAHAGVQSMCLWLPGPGSYGIAVYQDLNSNHKIDHTLFGPTEPWGFSRNPKALFALPRLSQVAIDTKAGDNVVHVRLNYP